MNHRITAGANYLVPRLEAKVGLSVEWNSRQRVATGKDEWTPDYLMLCANLSKTFCSACRVHCYKAEMRQKIREVMRFSGPRMLFYHPLLSIKHVLVTIMQHR